MPKLPSFQDVQHVSPQVQRDPGVNAPLQAFQSSSGMAATAFAPALEKLSHVAAVKEQQLKEVELINARTRLLQFGEKKMYDPDEGFLAKKGIDALQGHEAFQKDIDKKLDDVAKGLSSDDQRRAFTAVSQHWRQGISADISRHVLGQAERHADESVKAQVETSNRTAALAASRGNWDQVKDEMDMQHLVLQSEAKRKGFDEAQRADLIAGAKSGFHANVTQELVANDDVRGAMAYFDANKEDIDVNQQLHLEQLMRSRRSQDTGEARALLQQKIQDGNAMASKGVAIPKGFIDETLIQSAYPDKDVHADQVRRQVGLMYRTANDVASLKTKNNAELVDFVTKAREPSAARPDLFSEEARIQDHLKAQAAHIITERETRPMTYAAENGIGASNPIDTSNPNSVLTEIPNRIRTAYTMSHMFGSPFMPLEKQEAAALGRQVDSMTSQDKVNFFDGLNQAAKDPHGYQAVVQAIRPDSPVTGIVGVLMGKAHEAESPAPAVPGFGFSDSALGISPAGTSVKSRSVVVNTHMFGQNETMDARSVATMIAKGEDILNPTKADKQSDGKPKLFKMPPEEQLRQKWTDIVGDAYGGNRDAEEHSYQAYRAFYAAAAVQGRLPDTTADASTAQRAALAVSGGVYKVGGQNVLLPWGMNADQFKANLNTQWPSIKERIGNPNAELNDIKLISAPEDGQYVVFAGTGPVYDKQGNPIIIRVSP